MHILTGTEGNINSYCHFSYLQRTCEANAAGENCSFIFTIRTKSVPLDHFKLAYVVLQLVAKEYFETLFKKWKNRPF